MEESLVAIDKAQLTKCQSSWTDTLAQYKKINWQSLSKEQWNEALQSAHQAVKQLEADRTELTKPLNRDLKMVNDTFRPVKQAVDDFKTFCSEQLSQWARHDKQLQEETARQLAEQLAQETPNAGQLESALVAKALATETAAPTQGTRVSTRWVPEVVDLAAVPVQYLSVDIAALTKLGRASKTQPNVPGIRWTELVETKVTGRY